MTPQQGFAADTEIRALVQAADEAQNDVDALMRLHTDGVSIVNFGGWRLFGKAAFREAMTQALSTPLRDVPTTVTIDRIEPLSDSVAVVSCTKTVHDQRGEGSTPLPAAQGMLTYVVVRDAAGWSIASAQTTPVARS
jgi:uncharacterized protein (TIGR02246 family)